MKNAYWIATSLPTMEDIDELGMMGYNLIEVDKFINIAHIKINGTMEDTVTKWYTDIWWYIHYHNVGAIVSKYVNSDIIRILYTNAQYNPIPESYSGIVIPFLIYDYLYVDPSHCRPRDKSHFHIVGMLYEGMSLFEY